MSRGQDFTECLEVYSPNDEIAVLIKKARADFGECLDGLPGRKQFEICLRAVSMQAGAVREYQAEMEVYTRNLKQKNRQDHE